jgi:hypothetical protein
MQEIWVDRDDYGKTKIVNRDKPLLSDSEVLVSIDKFGLTANNVSYAVSGKAIGYWGYYPADDNWGKVPVWGMADIVESNCDELKAGERIWGFFPMASHVVLQPGQIRAQTFADMAEHRQSLPLFYNQYQRTEAEPDYLKTLEDERCLLFPLFATSFVLNDFLEDNDFFDAGQILIGSVSSKTGFGLASFLSQNEKYSGKVVGLTSRGNVDFVERLNCCDQIVVYGDEAQIDNSKASAFVDMSGNGALVRTLHEHLQDNMLQSIGVGATHWNQARAKGQLPGAQPQFFFAPSQMDKRDKEWGRGMLFQKAFAAGAELANQIKGIVNVELIEGADNVEQIWTDMLANNVSARRGIMATLKE